MEPKSLWLKINCSRAFTALTARYLSFSSLLLGMKWYWIPFLVDGTKFPGLDQYIGLPDTKRGQCIGGVLAYLQI